MPFDCRLFQPFNMLIAGPSKSGKTTFLSNLLKVGRDMFEQAPDYVLLYYTNDQPLYQELYQLNLINEMINFNENEPRYEEIKAKVSPYTNGNGSLIIFDDTLSDIKSGFEKVFQVLGHHNKSSLIYLTQNLFYDNKAYRNVSLQLDYITLLRNQRSGNQIRSLANQLCQGDTQWIISAYDKATEDPYGYLFVDCGSNTKKELSLRSHMFPWEGPYRVYTRTSY